MLNPVSYLKDLRNSIIGLGADVIHFSYHHPLLSLGSAGTLPLVYSISELARRTLNAMIQTGTELVLRSYRVPSFVNVTTQQTTVPHHRSWSLNPCNLIPFSMSPFYGWALWKTPKFRSYTLALPQGHPCKGAGILSTSYRPINFLADALFAGTSINVTPPVRRGSWFCSLFNFNCSQEKVARFLEDKALLSPDGEVRFSAKGKSGHILGTPVTDWSEVYGKNEVAFSYKELKEVVDSQQIFLSRHMPRAFYLGSKKAMEQDGIVTLPNIRMKDVRSLHFYLFLKKVEKDPIAYGFSCKQHFHEFSKLSLYQVGTMVVKTQKAHLLVDGDNHLIARRAGSNHDSFQLVDACGIRDFFHTELDSNVKQALMKEMFRTALIACKQGIALFPAVGMGVWGGDPHIYWRALLEAICETGVALDYIGINPGHAPTPAGPYRGATGEEFAKLLQEYKSRARGKALSNLNKIHNLHSSKKDIVQLARHLKQQYPSKQVSLLNASDPDVTYGGHLGEYTRSMSFKCSTTEENYAAILTSFLCFEGVTRIQQAAHRIFQS